MIEMIQYDAEMDRDVQNERGTKYRNMNGEKYVKQIRRVNSGRIQIL